MDIINLKLELTDFSHCTSIRWFCRRVLVGSLLVLYYLYACVFFLAVAFPESDPLDLWVDADDGEMVIPALMTMMTFGFIGGVFSLTRTFIRTAQKYVDGQPVRQDLPVSWYISRPMQSALMAIFIYYTFRAGQLIFFSMEGAPAEDEINVYTLAMLAIVAGAFSDEAFIKLHSVATGVFRKSEPRNTTEAQGEESESQKDQA